MREERMPARGRSFRYIFTLKGLKLPQKAARGWPWERRWVPALIFDINTRSENLARLAVYFWCRDSTHPVNENWCEHNYDARTTWARCMACLRELLSVERRSAQKWFSPEFNCEHAPKLPLFRAPVVDEWNGREKKVPPSEEVGRCRVGVCLCVRSKIYSGLCLAQFIRWWLFSASKPFLFFPRYCVA